jgi:bacillithiol biosynthesis deacetylase BshB1
MSGHDLDILIFGAHPDDAEIGMAGTIIKHAKAGYKIGICDLTHAEMSSNGTVETRREEAEEAARILRLAARTNLGLPDRGLFLCPEHIEAIVMEIRKYRPKIVFAPYWEDRHPDHVMCSRLVEEAVFNAKLRNYRPDAQPITVEQLYFYFINDITEADLLVEINPEDYMDKKNALFAYRSQFGAADATNNLVRTPLNQGYLERVEARDRLLGQKRMFGYAEGFVSKLPFQVHLF